MIQKLIVWGRLAVRLVYIVTYSRSKSSRTEKKNINSVLSKNPGHDFHLWKSQCKRYWYSIYLIWVSEHQLYKSQLTTLKSF